MRAPLATALTLIVIAVALALPAGLALLVDNLRVATGGIDNAPMRLFDSPMPAEPVLLLVEIALLIAWPWLTRRLRQRGVAPILVDSLGPDPRAEQAEATG